MSEAKPRLSIENDERDQVPAQDGSPVPQGGEPEGPVRKRLFFATLGSWLHESFPGHENAVLGGAAGLAAALLVFALGLLRTIFVLVCVLLGTLVGQWADGNPRIVRLVRRLLSDGSNER
ncbi:DUF2273 domain-containing protein [Olsenella urininfantis]|uniref:DUF2273 domain-containing protein n=1 Tax=Olsenella urininfantis TaxID=1871033 RepID=UPI0009842E8F|nr:DUF2273 domain-containing protein [Olsenella urininfantis]